MFVKNRYTFDFKVQKQKSFTRKTAVWVNRFIEQRVNFLLGRVSVAMVGTLFFLLLPFGQTVQAAELAQSQGKEDSVRALDTVVVKYPDGVLARLYTVQKGTSILEGFSFSYHPNGKLAIEIFYKNGKTEGSLKRYAPTGRLLSVTAYADGLEHGLSESFYEDGKRQLRENYKAGELDGVSEKWDVHGVLRQRSVYVNGKMNGRAKIFDEKGLIVEEMDFKNGLREGYYRRYTRGILTEQMRFLRNRCDSGCGI